MCGPHVDERLTAADGLFEQRKLYSAMLEQSNSRHSYEWFDLIDVAGNEEGNWHGHNPAAFCPNCQGAGA
jgi:hypothetical protein